MKNLNIYKAKSCGKSIYEHNLDLYRIANQIQPIYDIDLVFMEKLKRCIEFHDVGKVVKLFQDMLDGDAPKRDFRHEVISSSIEYLDESERLAIITHHKDIEKLNGYVENESYEMQIKELSEKLDVKVKDIRDFIKKINRKNTMVKDIDNILLKGYLQYCDHVGSAEIKEIDIGFHAKGSFIYENYNSIQKEVLSLCDNEDILIIGPTGVGKTASSLYWSDMVQNKTRSKRIYYILPYTASINSLYKDMLKKEISVAMLHNKAEYFLENIDLENPKEQYDLFKKSIKQVNICTIYQIVKAIFSCKRFEMLLAQLKNSIFIIDEIHCFDIEQLGILMTTLKFLKEKLNISICIMSASVSSNIQKIIQEELNINKLILAKPSDYKVRHKINRKNKNIIDDLNDIKNDLDNGKKVLVCVNTVSQAQELYMKLKEYNPTMIHSRYNSRDREKAESNIEGSNLLIGTQAIEVSLDISYHVLYTQVCPFDSLLQRFGRVNRYGEYGVSDIYIYDDEDNYVYDDDVILKTEKVLVEIIEKDEAMILESKTQYYLDKVYDEFDKVLYSEVCMKVNHLIKNLKLGSYNKEVLDMMFCFNTLSVLPEVLLDEYTELINKKEYLKARGLLVSIRKSKVHYNYINLDKELNIYITTYNYDECGLHYF